MPKLEYYMPLNDLARQVHEDNATMVAENRSRNVLEQVSAN